MIENRHRNEDPRTMALSFRPALLILVAIFLAACSAGGTPAIATAPIPAIGVTRTPPPAGDAYAGFSASAAPNSLVVTITDTSSDAASVAYHWGDGSSDNYVTPTVATHTYPSTGIYTITQTVFGAGGPDVVAHDIAVPAPVAGFALDHTAGITGQTIFTATSTATGMIDSTIYDWGDGNFGTDSSHIYDEYYGGPHTYTVTQAVSNVLDIDTASQEIMISPAVNVTAVPFSSTGS
jgi:PKD repeat protein